MIDWRLTNQESYLKGVKLQRLQYALRKTKTDHDHCEFCMDKFGDENGDLHIGYCTTDHYRWICDECYEDFKGIFDWTIVE